MRSSATSRPPTPAPSTSLPFFSPGATSVALAGWHAARAAEAASQTAASQLHTASATSRFALADAHLSSGLDPSLLDSIYSSAYASRNGPSDAPPPPTPREAQNPNVRLARFIADKDATIAALQHDLMSARPVLEAAMRSHESSETVTADASRRVNGLSAELELVRSKGAVAASTVSSLETTVGRLRGVITSLESRCNDLTARLAESQQAGEAGARAASTAAAAAAATEATLRGELDSVLAEVTGMAGSIAGLRASHAAAGREVAHAQADAAAARGEAVRALATSAAADEAREAAEDRELRLTRELAAVSAHVAALREAGASATARNASLSASLDDTSLRLHASEGAVAGLRAAAKDAQAQFDAALADANARAEARAVELVQARAQLEHAVEDHARELAARASSSELALQAAVIDAQSVAAQASAVAAATAAAAAAEAAAQIESLRQQLAAAAEEARTNAADLADARAATARVSADLSTLRAATVDSGARMSALEQIVSNSVPSSDVQLTLNAARECR